MLYLDETKLIRIFCECDDFFKKYEQFMAHKNIGKKSSYGNRDPRLCESEIMTLLILYHLTGVKCFQYYYTDVVSKHFRTYFPGLVSYNRFIELMPRCLLPLWLFVNTIRTGEATGFYYADSKKMPVCDNLRIKKNKVFKAIAGRSKSSTGWFYGLKLFLVINQYGQVMRCILSAANVADNNITMMRKVFNKLQGFLFADKGFISQKAFEEFYCKGLKIVTTVKRNMKNKLMSTAEKLALKKRGVIESVNDLLMTICDIDHTRHRSPINALTHALAGVTAYTYLDKLPSIFAKKYAVV
jgi:Transposase DDE domain